MLLHHSQSRTNAAGFVSTELGFQGYKQEMECNQDSETDLDELLKGNIQLHLQSQAKILLMKQSLVFIISQSTSVHHFSLL